MNDNRYCRHCEPVIIRDRNGNDLDDTIQGFIMFQHQNRIVFSEEACKQTDKETNSEHIESFSEYEQGYSSQIESDLHTNGFCLCMTVGDSMEPLLREQQNAVLIERVDGKLKENDVVLFRRPKENKYVLHRIIKVRKDDYLICGDNRLYREPVPHEWVIGVMRGYYEGEQFIEVTSRCYRNYVVCLRKRYWIRWLHAFPKRVYKKLVRFYQHSPLRSKSRTL